MKKPELLCPAKGIDELKTAVVYGADAVYIGGETFSLRAKAKNFTKDEIAEGIDFAHERGVKVHVTANILAHDRDIEDAYRYFGEMRELKPDAFIIADPGMFTIAKEVCPEIDRHISTHANNTNYMTYRFWADMGAKRVVAARELSMAELRDIRERIPASLEMECFIHGSMCISYSGRCLLSNYFTGRDANHGACTHPCRWKYNAYEMTENSPFETSDGEIKYAIEEESRPGEYLPVYENERGTYIFNSRDLCMIEHVPELIEAGIDSWTIEGRMKTALYVATVARTYRKAIDDYFESPEKYRENLPWYREQIAKCTYRKFSTGFFFGKPDEDSQIYDNNTYSSDAIFLAIPDREARADINGREVTLTGFEQKNKFSVGDTVEIMRPDGSDVSTKVLSMYHVCDGGRFEKDVEERVEIEEQQCMPAESCPHAGERVWAEFSVAPEAGDILRVTM